jgi:hypothetical protein
MGRIVEVISQVVMAIASAISAIAIANFAKAKRA